MRKIDLLPVIALALSVSACMSNPPPDVVAKPTPSAGATYTAPVPVSPNPAAGPTATSGTAPTAPAVAGRNDPYFQDVNDQLAKFSVYPPSLLGSGQYGDVVVSISTGRDGKVLSASVLRGSGHPDLDKAAVKAVYDASPLPAVPAWIPGNSVLLQMTMAYSQR